MRIFFVVHIIMCLVYVNLLWAKKMGFCLSIFCNGAYKSKFIFVLKFVLEYLWYAIYKSISQF